MHTDPELLSLWALGESVGTAEDRAHLRGCTVCTAELDELRRLVTLGRSVDADTVISVPSPTVWDRIVDVLALGTQPQTAAAGARADAEPPSTATADPAWSLRQVMVAALAEPDPAITDEQSLRATLGPVPTGPSGASGQAVLATDPLGRRVLQLELRDTPGEAGLRHARLVHRDDATRRLVLGVLDGPYGVWTVDRSIDLGQYATLEVVGPGDEDAPALVRGELVPAA